MAVAALRTALGKCNSWEWQRAGAIMQQIVQLLGKTTGPEGARVEPRACKYCKYYGHTSQHCAQRLQDEAARCERESDVLLAEFRKWERENGGAGPNKAWNDWLAWADKRYAAACDAGWGCDEQESACGACAGCTGWREFIRVWSQANPAPPMECAP